MHLIDVQLKFLDIQLAEYKQTHFNTSEKCKYSLSGSENAISSSLSASSTDEANLIHMEKHNQTSIKKFQKGTSTWKRKTQRPIPRCPGDAIFPRSLYPAATIQNKMASTYVKKASDTKWPSNQKRLSFTTCKTGWLNYRIQGHKTSRLVWWMVKSGPAFVVAPN